MSVVPHHTNGTPALLGPDGNPWRKIPDGEARARSRGMVLPNAWQFVAKVGGGDNTFWHDRWDEAMRHAREDAIDMTHDCRLMAMVEERQLAVSSLKWHLEVPDEKDKFQLKVKDGLTRVIKGIHKLPYMIPWWLQAVWYGRYGVQCEWKKCEVRDDDPAPDESEKQEQAGQQMLQQRRRGDAVLRYLMDASQANPNDPAARGAVQQREREIAGGMPKPGKSSSPDSHKMRKALTVDRCWPLNGDLIGHQEDHTPYVLVNASEVDNLRKLDPNVSIVNTTLNPALSLRGSWRDRFIIHRQWIESRDFFQPDQAEAMHGVGLRSHLFWTNWLKLEAMAKIVDFYDRIGLGVNLWKYAAGNPQAEAAVKQAAKENSSRANIFIPVIPGQEDSTTLERIEVPTAGAEALMKLLEYYDQGMERAIVGQEGSASATSSDGHSNKSSSEFQQDTKLKIAKQDAAWLGCTLTGSDHEPGLVNTIQKFTYPEADFPVWWRFDVESQESTERLTGIKTLVDMGVKVKADDARAAAGVSKPADGEEVITPPQPPGAAAGTPPGAPGAAPGGAPDAGGNPLAALMGGAGGAPGEQEQPGAEGEGAPAEPGAEQEKSPGGDFLNVLQQARRYTKDAAGHEHRGKGPHGGEFTSTGKAGGKKQEPASTDEAPLLDVDPASVPRTPTGKSKPAKKATPSPASKGQFGQAGDKHPLAGLAREQQQEKLGQAAIEAERRNTDPLGIHTGAPSGLDMAAFGDDVIDATSQHAKTVGGDTPFDKLYAVVGKKYDLSKHDFLRAIHAMDDEDKGIRLGAPASPRDITDPELAGTNGGGETWYAYPKATRFAKEGAKRHKFSTTHFVLPDEIAEEVAKIAAGIANEDLAGEGREEMPHLTAKYGLHTENPDDVRNVVGGTKPVRAWLGKIGVFPGSKSSDGADVLKIEVHGNDLHLLNRQLSGLPHTDSHPGYKPHITLAYVKPGTGDKYLKPHALEGEELLLNRLHFCNRDGDVTQIPLGQHDRGGKASPHARLGAAIHHLRQQGREDVAQAVVQAYARRRVYERGWNEKEHPRGQPENKGEFVAKGQANATQQRPADASKANIPGTVPTPAPAKAPAADTPTIRPDRAMSPQERQQGLGKSPVHSATPLGGGITKTVLLELADGLQGVFKPASGERYVQDQTAPEGLSIGGEGVIKAGVDRGTNFVRKGVDAGTYWRREIAAYDVAEALGFGDLVPVTTMREHEGDVGSMQNFAGGAQDACKLSHTERYDGDEDASRAAAFDYLIGHMDRHSGNWMAKDGKLILIDNGLSFPKKYVDRDYFNMKLWNYATEENLPLPDMTSLADRWPAVESALRKSGIEPSAVAHTKERFDALTSGDYGTISSLPSLLPNYRDLGHMTRIQQRQRDLT